MKDETKINSSTESVEYTSGEVVQLQYEFERPYTFFSAYSINVSVSGLFSTIGTSFIYPLLAGGGPGIVWNWFYGGFVLVFGIAFSVAELVSAYPTSGGNYHATFHVFPPKYAKYACWLNGWMSFLGNIAITASSEYGGAQMLLAFVSMCTDFRYVPTDRQTVGVVSALILFHGFINCLPPRYIEKVTWLYTIFHFGALISGGIALLAKVDPRNDADYVFVDIETNSGWSNKGFSFLFGLIAPCWTLTLFDAVAHSADSLQEPAKNAPLAITAGMFTTYVLGFLYNIALAFSMKKVEDIMDESLPVSTIYYNALGKGGGIAYTFFMFIVMNFVGISVLQSASWSIWAQSNDNFFPGAKKYLSKIFGRLGTPVYSVALATLLSICVDLIGLGSQTTISAIFNVTAIALLWNAAIPIIGKLCYPHLFKRGPFHLGAFSVPINILSVAWTCFVTVLFCFPYTLPVIGDPSAMNYAAVFLVFTVAAASLAWVCGCKHLYKGPQYAFDGESEKSSVLG